MAPTASLLDLSGSTLRSRSPSTAATSALSRLRSFSTASCRSGSSHPRRRPAVSDPSSHASNGAASMPDPASLYHLPTLVRREMRRLASHLVFQLLGLTLL